MSMDKIDPLDVELCVELVLCSTVQIKRISVERAIYHLKCERKCICF